MKENLNQRELIELLSSYPDESRRLTEKLNYYGRNRQTKVFFSRIAWGLVSLVSVLLIFLLVERTPIQSEFLRLVASLFFYGCGCWWIFLAFRSFTQPPTDIELSVEIEAVSPKFLSSLSSAVEFNETVSAPGTSSALRKLTVSFASLALTELDTTTALKKFSRRKSFFSLLCVGLLIWIWYSISPLEVRKGLERIIKPFADISAFSPLVINIWPGNRLVARGENVQIMAIPNQPMDHDPVLTLFSSGSSEGKATEMYPDETASRSRYIYTLTGLQETIDYQVSSDKFISERFSIKVVPRPEIKHLFLTLHHPAYLATEPQKLPDGVGDCRIIKGSRVDIEGQAAQRIKFAEISFEPGATMTCEIAQGDRFKTSVEIATTTRYAIQITNEFDLKNINPVRYQISAITDASPSVNILKPAADLPFPKSKRLDLKVEAKDDFGIVSVILYYSIGDRSHFIPMNMKADFSPMREFEVEYPWMLDTVAVEPGTQINYFVKAEDAMKPHPQWATTPTYKVNMPSMYDIYKGSEETHQEVSDKLKEVYEAQKLRRQSLMKAFEEIKHEGKLDYNTEKEIEKAVEEGEQREKQGQEILEKFQKLQENLKENPLSSPDALEKLQKVNELLNDVLDDEAKRLMKQLRESMNSMKLDPKDMEKFEQAFKMDEYLKKLDRTVELLQQLKDAMKLNSLGNALQDLQKRQERIASETAALEEKTKNADMQNNAIASDSQALEDAEKMKDLTRQQEQIQKALQRLNERIASETAALEEKMKELKAQEKAASDELEKQKNSSASDSQNLEIANKIKDLAQQQEKIKEELKRLQDRVASETVALEEKMKNLQDQEKAMADKQNEQDNAQASDSQSLEDKAKMKDLAKQQEKIKEELLDLQKQAQELAEKKPTEGEQEDPTKEDVKNIRDKMKQEDFPKTSDQIKKDLQNNKLSEAQKNQQKMLHFLRSLAKEGQKICNSCSGGETPQLDLSRFVRKAINVSRDQERLLIQTDGMPSRFMRGQKPAIEGIIDECSMLQLLVKRQGQDLEDALETLVKSSFSVNPQILDPLKGVQEIFSSIVKDLEDRAIGKARQEQRDIIRRFNLLAIELMKAQDQSQSQSSAMNPQNALQQFKQLTRRQLSLYQQSMKNQMSPIDQKLMEQMRQMAMEQKRIRESLDRLMREGKQQMQTLGRMEDVMKDMEDLDTKILDPKFRKEVAEKQKAIYDRMLKAQKSIRNRDEEKEERKAEKAREIIQINSEQPLPSQGSDTRDLSKNYLGEMKDEYPKAYEPLLQDYFKSLNLYGENN